MAHQQNAFKALHRRLVQGIPNEICTLHHRDAQAVQPVAGEKILAVIAGGQDQSLVPLGSGLPEFKGHGVDHGLHAHGFHDAGGT